MKHIGTWCNDSSIELVEVNGEVYALRGWNGEKYLHCFTLYGLKANKDEYELTPIYAKAENENGGHDVIDYEVRKG
jgi:hypothetical protein